MMNKPLIMVNTENYPKFCDNRCNNISCKKHLSQMRGYYGGAVITKLRDTEDCEGYISKRKKKEQQA